MRLHRRGRSRGRKASGVKIRDTLEGPSSGTHSRAELQICCRFPHTKRSPEHASRDALGHEIRESPPPPQSPSLFKVTGAESRPQRSEIKRNNRLKRARSHSFSYSLKGSQTGADSDSESNSQKEQHARMWHTQKSGNMGLGESECQRVRRQPQKECNGDGKRRAAARNGYWDWFHS